MLFVLELGSGALKEALTLDKDHVVSVDEDIRHGIVLEKRFERPEAEQLVEHFGDELDPLACVQGRVFFDEDFRNQVACFFLDLLGRKLVEDRKVDPVNQLAMDRNFQLKHAPCFGGQRFMQVHGFR